MIYVYVVIAEKKNKNISFSTIISIDDTELQRMDFKT